MPIAMPPDDDPPFDPAQARLVAKMRRFMLISGFATLLGIAVVLGMIGYRVFRSEGRATADIAALVPKGAQVTATAVAGDRLVVTLAVDGGIEVRTFDLATLKPEGRLRFVTEP
jgi:hypothetical protein